MFSETRKMEGLKKNEEISYNSTTKYQSSVKLENPSVSLEKCQDTGNEKKVRRKKGPQKFYWCNMCNMKWREMYFNGFQKHQEYHRMHGEPVPTGELEPQAPEIETVTKPVIGDARTTISLSDQEYSSTEIPEMPVIRILEVPAPDTPMPEIVPRYPCKLCGEVFENYNELSDHKSTEHAHTVWYQRVSKRKLEKSKHFPNAKIVSSETLARYQCKLCERTFFNERGLSIHEVRSHIKNASAPKSNNVAATGAKDSTKSSAKKPTTAATIKKESVVEEELIGMDVEVGDVEFKLEPIDERFDTHGELNEECEADVVKPCDRRQLITTRAISEKRPGCPRNGGNKITNIVQSESSQAVRVNPNIKFYSSSFEDTKKKVASTVNVNDPTAVKSILGRRECFLGLTRIDDNDIDLRELFSLNRVC